MKLARVFARKTRATPDDELAFYGPPPFTVDADEVHVDVTFTADKLWGEKLAEQWKPVAPVKIGGVAYGDRGDGFTPGRYIKQGYTLGADRHSSARSGGSGSRRSSKAAKRCFLGA